MIRCLMLLGFTMLLVLSGPTVLFAAHTDEPLNTEIPATPPRGRTFGQLTIDWTRTRSAGIILDTVNLPVEFELGLSARGQFNIALTPQPLQRMLGESLDPDAPPPIVTRRSPLSEFAVGYKHRVLDETRHRPDMALAVEFAPVAERGNAVEFQTLLILGKILSPKFRLYANLGYRLEHAKREEDTHSLVYNLAPAYTVVPERLQLVLEANGITRFQRPGGGRTDLQLVPELLWAPWPSRRTTLKVGIPVGLTRNSPDFGVQCAVSHLF